MKVVEKGLAAVGMGLQSFGKLLGLFDKKLSELNNKRLRSS